MTSLEPKLGAPVINQIVFGIEPPMDELGFFVLIGPGQIPVFFRYRKKRRQKRPTDISG